MSLAGPAVVHLLVITLALASSVVLNVCTTSVTEGEVGPVKLV